MDSALLKKVRSIDALSRAWKVIHRNGMKSRSAQTRAEIENFAENVFSHVTKIQRQLSQDAFRFRSAQGIAVPKKSGSGIRPLVIAPIESRIVQRAIHDVLLSLPAIRQFAESPRSFGGVRKSDDDVPAAVPGAIQAILKALGNGAKYVVRSDISSFFTRIPKQQIASIVWHATGEEAFMKLFNQAVNVELANLDNLRQHASNFPTEEIGVAQGCSLSPLLGNMILSDFDQEMNSEDIVCIRYIDDFIILAEDRAAGRAAYVKARQLLNDLGMQVSDNKTFKGEVRAGFTFLGIELMNGSIRPSRESRTRLVENVRETFSESSREFRSLAKSGDIRRSQTLIRTLYKASMIVHGWGKAYKFCNERNVFQQMDALLDVAIREYLGSYAALGKHAAPEYRRRILGIPLLVQLASEPFDWPETRELN